MYFHYFELGGVMMWPLLACSVLLGAVLFERFWMVVVFHKLFRRPRAKLKLNYHQRIMPFFVDIPPSIGLLGTVMGVVQSFNLSQGRLTAETAAAGLGVACFTTIFGLSISIVASISNYFLGWLSDGSEMRMKGKS